MRLSLIIPCLLLLSTVGCSAPEGQNAVMYLSSVTVQERRIETDARAIDEILVQSQNGNIDSQALLKAIPLIDPTLNTILEKSSSTLTPKETFFCVMEYYGKTDKQKACSFCCSEQAVRSTKSRLNKKMDISVLRPE